MRDPHVASGPRETRHRIHVPGRAHRRGRRLSIFTAFTGRSAERRARAKHARRVPGALHAREQCEPSGTKLGAERFGAQPSDAVVMADGAARFAGSGHGLAPDCLVLTLGEPS